MEGAIPSTKDRPRMRSKAERRQIVEKTFQAGESVWQVARAHNVNANQVFQWRRLYRAGLLDEEPAKATARKAATLARACNPGFWTRSRPVLTR